MRTTGNGRISGSVPRSSGASTGFDARAPIAAAGATTGGAVQDGDGDGDGGGWAATVDVGGESADAEPVESLAVTASRSACPTSRLVRRYDAPVAPSTAPHASPLASQRIQA